MSLLDMFVVRYDNKKPVFNPEDDEGYIEYKLRLDYIDKDKILKMKTQMKYRLMEGKEKIDKYIAYYFIGVDNNGITGYITHDVLQKSINVLRKIVDECNFKIENMETYNFNNSYFSIIAITKKNKEIINEYRIIFSGPSNHGKTTTISSLTFNDKDNGNGSGRSSILKHKHEYNTGLTSSIVHDIIGITKDNKINNYRSSTFCSWDYIVDNSDKILSLIDLPGSDKYFHTAIYGTFSYRPHLNAIVISVSEFLKDICKILRIINISISTNIKFIIIFTKIDEMDNFSENEIKDYINIFKENINTEIFDKFYLGHVSVSNISQHGYDKLLSLLINIMPQLKKTSTNINTHTDFLINDIFNTETDNIVAGIVVKGNIRVGDKLNIGPYNGQFYPVTIKSIYKKKSQYDSINENEFGSFSLKLKNKIELDKHMSIISDSLIPKSDIFHIKLDDHSLNLYLKLEYKYMLYVDNIYELINIIAIEDNIITFKFEKQIIKENYLIYIRNESRCLIKYDRNLNENFISGIVF
jgi:GTPase